MKHFILLILTLFMFPAISQNLTGTWKCDDGGTYYLRQDGNELWWYGDGKPNFTNVMHGTISGKEIRADWIDVPAGRARNGGKMTLQIVSENELRRTAPNYKGWSVWTRNGANPSAPPPVVSGGSSSGDIGNYWEFEQLNNGWKGTWTRIGNSNLFNGVLTNGSRTISSKVEITRNGNKLTVKRVEASNNTYVWYEGTFENDGVTVNGYYCYASGKLPSSFTSKDKWRAKMINTGDIGKYWEFEQLNNGWKGTWTRIGNSNLFNGVLTNGSRTISSKVEITRNGNKLTVKRVEASNNTFVWYEGTFENDGVTVNGDYSYASGKLPSSFTPKGKWRATMKNSR